MERIFGYRLATMLKFEGFTGGDVQFFKFPELVLFNKTGLALHLASL